VLKKEFKTLINGSTAVLKIPPALMVTIPRRAPSKRDTKGIKTRGKGPPKVSTETTTETQTLVRKRTNLKSRLPKVNLTSRKPNVTIVANWGTYPPTVPNRSKSITSSNPRAILFAF
jgi:hypothetical protein